MKRYTLSVECRGCQHPITLGFNAPKIWCDRSFPARCSKCGSDILIEVRQPKESKKQIMTRVKMIKHTKKLERMLKMRALKKKLKALFVTGEGRHA